MDLETAIGRLLTIGMGLCLILVLLGAVDYIWVHGHDPINHAWFQQQAKPHRLWSLWLDASRRAEALMQLGLFLLVVIQVLRVALIAGYFVKGRDYIFAAISLFVLGTLVLGLI